MASRKTKAGLAGLGLAALIALAATSGVWASPQATLSASVKTQVRKEVKRQLDRRIKQIKVVVDAPKPPTIVQGPDIPSSPITRVEGPGQTLAPGQNATDEAKCPAGQRAISGGFITSGPVRLTSFDPFSSARSGWQAQATNEGTTTGHLEATAYCVAINTVPVG